MDRLDKVISNKGFGSRKEIKKIIKKGNVKVNGETIQEDSFKVNFDDVVEVNGSEFIYKEFVYIMLNKPNGVISATTDLNHETVIDIIDDKTKGLFPVGRLDIDTEGFCLISNDGVMAHKILSPRNHVSKTYQVYSESKLSNEDIKIIKEGIVIDNNEKCLPALIETYEDYYELTIFEGKYHQIKRMFETLNNKVLYLKRIKIGELKLDPNLDIGDYRYLSDKEVEMLSK